MMEFFGEKKFLILITKTQISLADLKTSLRQQIVIKTKGHIAMGCEKKMTKLPGNLPEDVAAGVIMHFVR